MVCFAAVKWFKDVSRADTSLAGSKGTKLSELWNAGFPVPNGFVIISKAYEEFLVPIRERISGLYNAGDAEGIQRIILSTPMPKDLAEEIIDNYEALDEIKDVRQAIELIRALKNDVIVAVRSSPKEDRKHATFLNVRGNDQILKAVRACWASLFSTDAVKEYHANNVSFEELSMPVIVQKMINQEKSGSVIADSKLLVIHGCYGSSEGLAESSDKFYVDKNTLQIIDKQISKQDYAVLHDSRTGQSTKVEISDEYKSNQKISDKHVHEIARLAKEISELFASTVVVDWTVSKDAVNILQAKEFVSTAKEDVQETPAEIAPETHEEPAQEIKEAVPELPSDDDEDDDPEPEQPFPLPEPDFDVPMLDPSFSLQESNETIEVVEETIPAARTDALDSLWKKTAELRNEIISAIENPDLEDEKLSRLTETLKLCNKILKTQ